MRIAVVAYDPQWPERFEEERAVLGELLEPWLRGGVHHIGSTSIPGLAAKPILDMMAGVDDLVAAAAAIPLLEARGYRNAPHRPTAHWFYKSPTGERLDATHGLHLTEPGSDIWRERLVFRDALRADPVLREEYQALKQRLAAAHDGDLPSYTAHKREFVAAVLARSGITLTPR